MKHTSSQGFTIMELLISISIILIVSTLVIFQYRNYNDTSSLRGQAHEIALLLREAQVNATNGKEFAPNTNQFKIQYGVQFIKSATAAPSTYSLFGDRDSDGLLETTTNTNTNELLAQYQLRSNNTIDICAKTAEASPCVTPAPTQFNVLYNYGNFTAVLKDVSTGSTYQYAEIILYKPSNPTIQEKVKLWSIGRIEN
jgi:prepilin-type N-terminal cleavage/methylation domain-containing protein